MDRIEPNTIIKNLVTTSFTFNFLRNIKKRASSTMIDKPNPDLDPEKGMNDNVKIELNNDNLLFLTIT